MGKGLTGKSKGRGVTVGSKTTIYKGFGSRAKYNHARIKRYRLIERHMLDMYTGVLPRDEK